MGQDDIPGRFSEMVLNEASPEESLLALRAREGRHLRDHHREVDYNFLYSSFALTVTSHGRLRDLTFPPVRIHRGDLGLALVYRGPGSIQYRRLEESSKEIQLRPGQMVVRGSDAAVAYALTFYPSPRDPNVAYVAVEVENISPDPIDGSVLFEVEDLALDNARDLWTLGPAEVVRETSDGVHLWRNRGVEGLWAGLSSDPRGAWNVTTPWDREPVLRGVQQDLRAGEPSAYIAIPLQRTFGGLRSDHLPPGARCTAVLAFAWGRTRGAVYDSLSVARRMHREDYQEFLQLNRRLARGGTQVHTGIRELDLLLLFAKVQARWMYRFGKAHPLAGHAWLPAGCYTFFGAFERDGFLGAQALSLLGDVEPMGEDFEVLKAFREGPMVPHEVWWRVSRRGLRPWRTKQGTIGDAEPFFVLRAYHHFAQTRDRAILHANIQAVVDTLDYMESFQDYDGLLAANEIANYAELRPLRCGDRSVNPLHNALAAWALDRGAELCHYADRPVDAARFAAAALRIRARLEPGLFDPALGFYVFERVRGEPGRAWRHKHIQNLDALLYRGPGEVPVARPVLDQFLLDGWARGTGLHRSVPASDPWCESDESYWRGGDWNLFNFKIPWLCFRHRHNMDWAMEQLRGLASYLVSYDHPAMPGEHSRDNGLFLFSLGALVGCVMEGLLGLRLDAGGVTLDPVGQASGMVVKNLSLPGPGDRRTTLAVRVEGSGDHVREVSLDGISIPTLRLGEPHLDGGSHALVIYLSPNPGEEPLLRDTVGTVEAIERSADGLRYRISGPRGTDTVVNLPRPAAVRVDGREARWDWRPLEGHGLGILTLDRPAGEATVEVFLTPPNDAPAPWEAMADVLDPQAYSMD